MLINKLYAVQSYLYEDFFYLVAQRQHLLVGKLTRHIECHQHCWGDSETALVETVLPFKEPCGKK